MRFLKFINENTSVKEYIKNLTIDKRYRNIINDVNSKYPIEGNVSANLFINILKWFLDDAVTANITKKMISAINEINTWTMFKDNKAKPYNEIYNIFAKHLLREPNLFDESNKSIESTLNSLEHSANAPKKIINIVRKINEKFPLIGDYSIYKISITIADALDMFDKKTNKFKTPKKELTRKMIENAAFAAAIIYEYKDNTEWKTKTKYITSIIEDEIAPLHLFSTIK